MSDRIGKGVAAHLPHSVDSNVQSHLGKFTADSEDALGSQGYLQTKIRKSKGASEQAVILGVWRAWMRSPPRSRAPSHHAGCRQGSIEQIFNRLWRSPPEAERLGQTPTGRRTHKR